MLPWRTSSSSDKRHHVRRRTGCRGCAARGKPGGTAGPPDGLSALPGSSAPARRAGHRADLRPVTVPGSASSYAAGVLRQRGQLPQCGVLRWPRHGCTQGRCDSAVARRRGGRTDQRARGRRSLPSGAHEGDGANLIASPRVRACASPRSRARRALVTIRLYRAERWQCRPGLMASAAGPPGRAHSGQAPARRRPIRQPAGVSGAGHRADDPAEL
jgi:hypothetical protein